MPITREQLSGTAEHALLREQLRLLTDNVTTAAIVNLINMTVVLVVGHHAFVSYLAVLLWIFFVVAVVLVRLGIGLFVRQTRYCGNLNRLLKFYELACILTGFAWGSSVWLLNTTDMSVLVLFSFVIAGMSGGAIATLASSHLVSRGFIIAAVLPMVIRMYLIGSEIAMATALMGAIFIVATVTGAGRIHRTLIENTRLRLKTEAQTNVLKQKDEELSAIYDNATYYLVLLRPDGTIVRANRTAVVNAGLEFEPGSEQRNIANFPWWHEAAYSADKLISDLKRVSVGEVVRRELNLRLPSGRELRVEMNLTPIHFQGDVHYILLEAHDISLFKRIEQRLRESERRFREISEASGQYLWETDANGYFQFVSDKVHEVTGYSAEQLIGKKKTEFLTPMDAQRWTQALTTAASENKTVRIEVRSQRADGEWIWELISGVPLYDEAGSHIGYRGAAMPITDRKHYEETLIKAKEAAEAGTRAKSQFLAVMSHEIRTPMNGVMGMAELLMNTPLNEEQMEYARTIYQSSRALLEVINEILDLSKIESGKFELYVHTFDLHHLLEDIAELISVSARNKGIKFSFVMDEHIPKFVRADDIRIRQVLLNLLGNAVKFTQEGKVELSARLRHVRGHAYDIVFVVTDTGIGIPEDKLEHIFKPFQQADSSTSRRFGGTGLGLAISKELVVLMGGRIQVESEVNQGTTFRVELTLDSAEQPLALEDKRTRQQESQPDMSPSSRRFRVLLAEDNPVNQKVAMAMLKKFGADVVVAENGHEAVAAAEKTPFDIILMDCQMPELDGYEATMNIRAGHGPNRRTPIIALTAHAMAGDRDKCLSVGMNDYLAKPVSQTALQEVIRRHLGQGR
ncbi:MAG: PAS domain S-box protein [Gammaproteobacteria bacterium]|nr:MAG: PAS domain S-box protein [Gammaproteobacteria bacterium]